MLNVSCASKYTHIRPATRVVVNTSVLIMEPIWALWINKFGQILTGRLGMVDHDDVVELNNLHRQVNVWDISIAVIICQL